jgi:hypothetical protein
MALIQKNVRYFNEEVLSKSGYNRFRLELGHISFFINYQESTIWLYDNFRGIPIYGYSFSLIYNRHLRFLSLYQELCGNKEIL